MRSLLEALGYVHVRRRRIRKGYSYRVPTEALEDRKLLSATITTPHSDGTQTSARATAASGPEIAVALNNGTQVLDGQAAAINFGDLLRGTTATTTTFVIRNEGRQTLTLGAPSLPNGFVLVQAPQSSVAVGRSTVMIVAMQTSTAGSFNGEISIRTNDADENPFNFPVRGSVSLPQPAPEIIVAINGSNLSTTTADVRVGIAYQGQTFATVTLTLRNDGNAPLRVDNFRVLAGFQLASDVPGSIAPGSAVNVVVALDTGSLGIKSGTLQFQTNDSDEGSFSINLRGKVYAPIVTVPFSLATHLQNGVVEIIAGRGDRISIDYANDRTPTFGAYVISTTNSSGRTTTLSYDSSLTTVCIRRAADVTVENWTNLTVAVV